METRRWTLVLAFPILAALVHVTNVFAQVDQQTIAQQLLSKDPADRNRGLEMARALRPQNTGPELRAALITALERENATVRARREALRRGELPLPHVPTTENDFYGRVAKAVVELEDPTAITALSGALGTGLLIVRALAAFGEIAVPAVLAVVEPPKSPPHAVNDGLLALRFIVDGAATRPLPKSMQDDLRRAARQRLFGNQHDTTLLNAIDLGVTLDDPELTGIVSSLAYDRNEVIARGVTDPELIGRIQQRARDRLAGLPPLSRR